MINNPKFDFKLFIDRCRFNGAPNNSCEECEANEEECLTYLTDEYYEYVKEYKRRFKQ